MNELSMIERVLHNDMFAVLASTSVMGAVMYLLRDLPGKLWSFVLWRFTVDVLVFSEDAVFDSLNEWLASLDYTSRCRHLRISTLFRWQDASQATTVPGSGYHWFLWKGRFVLLHRSTNERQFGFYERPEEIRLRVLSWSRGAALMRQLLGEIMDTSERVLDEVQVHVYRDGWRKIAKKAARPLSSVVLQDGLSDRIVADLRRFIASPDWYHDRGIPYRRGVLFEGPPGTGKTSLVMALAGHLGRPIYALNLSSIASDNDLVGATMSVPKHAILLIEDVDAVKATGERGAEPAKIDGQMTVLAGQRETISLSGLLNALDGTFTRDGRILIMTTNHPDRLDPALLRPGRVDARFHIGLHGEREAVDMALQFGFDASEAHGIVSNLQLPISPADFQEILVRISSANEGV